MTATRRITIEVDVDLTDPWNVYTDGSNLLGSVDGGVLRPGAEVYVEFGTGDTVKGHLVSIAAAGEDRDGQG